MMSEDLGPPGLHLVPDEADQVIRLQCFRQARPEVAVGAGDGYWQAIVPEPDGSAVITRYTLRALLDRLGAAEGCQ